MGTLLGLMHSAPPTELQLKTDILRVSMKEVCFHVFPIKILVGFSVAYYTYARSREIFKIKLQ